MVDDVSDAGASADEGENAVFRSAYEVAQEKKADQREAQELAEAEEIRLAQVSPSVGIIPTAHPDGLSPPHVATTTGTPAENTVCWESSMLATRIRVRSYLVLAPVTSTAMKRASGMITETAYCLHRYAWPC